MSTIVISISPGDIQVISNSPPADGYSEAPARKHSILPQPELSIVEHQDAESDIPPLTDAEIRDLHDKYKM